MKFINELNDFISTLKKSHVSSHYTLVNELVNLYKSLVAPKCPVIKIGGSTLDHLANIDVIEDVVGTISSSFEKGVIVDGLSKILNNPALRINHKVNEIFLESIRDIRQMTIVENYHCKNVQNIGSFEEMFKRIKEILPKLLLTTSCIVPGSIAMRSYDKKDKD
jgi:hypothetical protein